MRFSVPSWQASAVLVTLVGLAGGCSNPCDTFNPYAPYDRTDPTDEEAKEPVSEAGKFQVVCFKSGDEQVIEQAINQALRDSGGGSAAKLSDKETTDALLQFARAPKGPYSDQPVALGKYEVKFRSGNIDRAQPIKVLWKGDEKGTGIQTFDTDGEAPGPVSLISESNPDEYSLHFKPEARLYVAGPQIVPRGTGYGLRSRQFEIKCGETVAEVRDILDENAEVLPPNVLIYEISGFSGDMSKFLCQLLREKKYPDPANPNRFAYFVMTNTYVWLNATGGVGGTSFSISAEFTHDAAAARAENVTVEIEGLGTFNQTQEGQTDQPHTLTAKFLPETRQVQMEFMLKKPERQPANDFVVFKYTIAGKEYRQRVRSTQTGGGK
jgi:hypothetical protein